MHVIIASFFVVFLLSFLTPVQASNSTYTVKKGDSLYEIADRLNVSVASLKEANRLRSNGIKPGAKLVIPGKRKADSGEQKEKELSASKKENRGAEKEKVYHTVRRGDTLEEIARKYSLPLKDLRELNSLKKDRLKAGQRLLVKRVETKRENSRKETSPEAESATFYTVKKGDTLKKIARRFDTAVSTLKEMNGLRKDSLSLGQRLMVAGQKEERSEPDDDARIVQAASTVTSLPRGEVVVPEEETEQEDLSKMSIPNRLILFAKKMLHLPYRFGGNSNFGIDCSAYVKKAYGLVGLNIPRSAREQFKVGEEVEKEELTVGDLVFFRTYASFPSHVGIYLGNNLFIHASSRAKKVTIDRLDAPYYVKRFIGAKRLLTEEKIPMLERELFRLKN